MCYRKNTDRKFDLLLTYFVEVLNFASTSKSHLLCQQQIVVCGFYAEFETLEICHTRIFRLSFNLCVIMESHWCVRRVKIHVLTRFHNWKYYTWNFFKTDISAGNLLPARFGADAGDLWCAHETSGQQKAQLRYSTTYVADSFGAVRARIWRLLCQKVCFIFRFIKCVKPNSFRNFQVPRPGTPVFWQPFWSVAVWV